MVRNLLKRINKKNTGESSLSGLELLLRIDGMHCASCALGIESFLKSMKGILEVKVDVKAKKARIIYDPNVVKAETIVQSPIFKEPSSFKAIIITEVGNDVV